MKIAIPSRSDMVDNHFGHCEYFSIIEVDNQKQVTQKSAMATSKSCGCKSNLAEELAQEGVTLLLAGGIGQGAVSKLKLQNIEVLTGFRGSIDEAIKQWKNNKFQLNQTTCVEHHNCSH
ncbi:MAG TPA: NifB/NifX family molybdenum-iron cluster-binding protein [Sunxiuqinia sp.]|nr:NifB/NifX family molybdenum-iron cluster-binding protein [Sunxiuqinia sp.]